MNMKKLAVLLVILASFSAFTAKAQEKQSTVSVSSTLMVCDHNGDGSRNLTDVSMFAQCKDTFDITGDNIHDLADISAYATYSNDNAWCAKFVCNPTPASTKASEVVVVDTLMVCDHNKDGLRNLTDVSMFAQCKDTFDVNGDGINDLSDLSAYTTNSQDSDWCNTNFVCNPGKSGSNTGSGASNAPDMSNIKAEVSCNNTVISWETSKDSLTLISYGNDQNYGSDYKSENYSSKHSFSLENLNPNATYYYLVSAEGVDGKSQSDYNRSFTTMTSEQCGQVLGEKIESEPEPQIELLDNKSKILGSCKLDEDVLGQTQWSDGSLVRGCDMKIYRIENQKKHYIKNFEELLKYIGQRIYNVADSVLELF